MKKRDCKQHRSPAQNIGFHQTVVCSFHFEIFIYHLETVRDRFITCFSGTSFLFSYEQLQCDASPDTLLTNIYCIHFCMFSYKLLSSPETDMLFKTFYNASANTLKHSKITLRV